MKGYIPISTMICGQSHQIAPGDIVRTAHSTWEFVGHDGNAMHWHDRDMEPDSEPRLMIGTPSGYFDGMIHAGAWVYAKEGSKTALRQAEGWARHFQEEPK